MAAAAVPNNLNQFFTFVNTFSECIQLNETQLTEDRGAVTTKYQEMMNLFRSMQLKAAFPEASTHIEQIEKSIRSFRMLDIKNKHYAAFFAEKFTDLRAALVEMGKLIPDLKDRLQLIPIPKKLQRPGMPSITPSNETAPTGPAAVVASPVAAVSSVFISPAPAPAAIVTPVAAVSPALMPAAPAGAAPINTNSAGAQPACGEEAHTLFYATSYAVLTTKAKLDRASQRVFGMPFDALPLAEFKRLQEDHLDAQNLHRYILDETDDMTQAIVSLAVCFVRLQTKSLPKFEEEFLNFLNRFLSTSSDKDENDSKLRVKKLQKLVYAIQTLFCDESNRSYHKMAMCLTAEQALLNMRCISDLQYCTFFKPHLALITDANNSAFLRFFIKQQAKIVEKGPAYAAALKDVLKDTLSTLVSQKTKDFDHRQGSSRDTF